MAWLTGWEYCKKIKVPASDIDGELSNFPLTVYLNDSNFDFSKCKADGSDIRFTDGALNPLKFERKEHNKYNATFLMEADVATPVDLTNTNSITNSGVSIVDGKFSNAYGYSGSSKTTITSSTSLLPSTSDWTIDFWIYIGSNLSSGSIFRFNMGETSSAYCGFGLQGGTGTKVNYHISYTGSSWGDVTTNFNLVADSWNHVACVRTGGYIKTYVNGNYATQSNVGANGLYSTSRNEIGSISAIPSFNGKIDQFRVSNFARYNSNFTPPTVIADYVDGNAVYNVQLPTVSDTTDTEVYMWYGNEDAYNNSMEAWQDMTGKALTYNGNVKLEYDSTLGRRRAVFDGSGDYFTSPYHADYNWNNSYCAEIWLMNIANHSNDFPLHIGNINPTGGGGYWSLGTLSNGKADFYYYNNSVGVHITGTSTIALDTFAHIAIVVSGSTINLYVNGVLENTASITGTPQFSVSQPLTLGKYSTYSLNGYISGVRLTKRARYTDTFTPPTSFEVDGDDVVFCTNFDTIYDENYAMVQHMGDSLVDATGNGNNLTNNGTTIVDTVFGKSRDFSGSSQYLTTPYKMGGDFTMITLMNFDVVNSTEQHITADWSGSYRNYLLELHSTNKLMMVSGNSGSTQGSYLFSNTVITAGQFNAVGFRRSGTNGSIHLNGNVDGSASVGYTSPATSNTSYIGSATSTAGFFNGQIVEQIEFNVAKSDAWIKAESLALKNALVVITDYEKKGGSLFFGMNF